MKLVKTDFPIKASWLEANGWRLDGKPYLSGAVEARMQLEKLSAEKQPLHKVTQGGINGNL